MRPPSLRALPRRFLGLLSVSGCAAALVAQDAWKLPERGAAEYRRTARAVSDTAPSAADAAKLEPKGEVPDGLLPYLAPSPWLCAGELTAERTAVGDEPRDLRDVLRAVAFDLRLDAVVKQRFHRLVPFGDLVITGKVAPRAADGSQTFVLDVATVEPEVRPGEAKAALQKFVRPLCKYVASGRLEVKRTFDAARGVVTSFDAELSLVFAEDKAHFRRLVVADRQELVGLHDNQDADFRQAVGKAIADGRKWLLRELGDLGRRHLKDEGERDRTYGAGRIALGLLTLLHAEVPVDDPVVAAGFDELRRRELVDSYSLAVALMALAERYAPPREAEQLRSGLLAAPKPRVLSDADKATATEWVTRLLKNVDTRLDPGYRLSFNYTAGPRFDNSIHQYALLGLYAASLCQVDVPATVWRATALHQLDVQCADNGRQARPDLVTYRELAAAAAADPKGRPTRGTTAAIPVRGFAYHVPDRPPYGSMTAAGVGSLVISRFGLLRSGQGKADVMPKIDAGIASGFAWLAEEFHVRCNPGYVDRADDSWYYYLYGLERTCELAGIALVSGRDWYFEGALQLLPQQNKNGAFRSERERGLLFDATCFAVLFLKKAALPPISGG